ncbi:MAG: FUSC family protein [Kofleriaceae bacterium]
MEVPGLDTVSHHVREAAKFAPERPAYWLGLRTAAATAIPLLIAQWIDPVAADWAPLAGFIVALVDKGGAYRTRAAIMGSAALGGLVAVLVGSMIAGHGILTAIAVAAGLGLCAFGLALGPALVSLSETLAVQFLVAASLPCTFDEAVKRTIGFSWGAGFALALALIVWPIRIYAPGRRAVAQVYSALARHVRRLSTELGQGEWRTAAGWRHREIRDQIEVARIVLAATRRGRRGETGRGERLMSMVQLADQMFGVVSGIEESIDAGASPQIEAIAREGLAALADGLAEIATNVVEERPPPSRVAAWSRRAPEGSSDETHALALLARTHADRAAAARVMATLYDDSEPLNAVVPEADPQPTLRERLNEAFDPRGSLIRHAIRVAVAVAVAMTIARLLGLQNRYWVTLTAFLLLQPQGAATRVLALQRLFGTAVGAAVAASIPLVIHEPRVMTVIAIVLAGVSASVVRINYGLYAAFLTPTFILLAEVHSHDSVMLGTRIANTAIGAGIAVLASLVWHIRPSRLFDDQIADAYEASRAYLDEVVRAVIGGEPQPSPAVLAKRRAGGVEINRCELALEQLMAERAPPSVIEPRMTQVVFLRRLAASINAFGATRDVTSYMPHAVEIAAFGASTGAALGELAAAARGELQLTGRPRVDRTPLDPVLAARFARIDRNVVSLYEAALRASRSKGE